jgi:ABC-type branched-subunit amino acid transport system ATPase component
MEIDKGEIVGIMGPNGAGKTTLINMISGFEPVNSGAIYLNGENITGKDPHIIAQKGIRRSFQSTSNFAEETITENVRAALISNNSISKRKCYDEVERVLEDVGLLDIAQKRICDVPIAVSKLIELCRCLISRPVLVLLDELYAGLTWEESKLVTKLLKEKKAELGTSFVLIEHRTEILFDAVDRIVVLSQGANFFEGLPNEVAANENVSKLYWGK